MTVAYYRVSTQAQGRSGLGLEAQQEAVRRFLGHDPTHEFVEIESGRKSDRPKLAEALAFCKQNDDVLIVAKLDRLARDVQVILSIVDSGAKVRFVDLPDIDATTSTGRLILSVMGSLAEFEARRISERTKDALAAAKARGQKLGSPSPRRGAVVAAKAKRAIACAHAREVFPRIEILRTKCGVTSLRGIAEALTTIGVRTASGGTQWHPSQVRRILERAT